MYMLLVHPSALGAVALIGLVAATSLITGVALFTRDGHTPEGQTSAATVDTPTPSMWPLVGAAGFALLLVGTITTPVVFIFGIVAMLALLVTGVVFSIVAMFRAVAGRLGDSSVMSAHALYWYFLTAVFVALWFVVYVQK